MKNIFLQIAAVTAKTTFILIIMTVALSNTAKADLSYAPQYVSLKSCYVLFFFSFVLIIAIFFFFHSFL